MPRVKHRRFTDEQLRVLLCIADNKPVSQDTIDFLQPIVPPDWKPRDNDRLTQKDLTAETGIEKGNLSHVVNELIADGYLVRQDSKESKRPGRPGEYLDLASPYVILDLRDELEYRMNAYEREKGELLDLIDNELIACQECACPGGWDEDKSERHFERYENALAKLKDSGLDSSGVTCSLKVVSYPMVRYWLWRMRQKAENVPVVKGIVCNTQFDGPFD